MPRDIRAYEYVDKVEQKLTLTNLVILPIRHKNSTEEG